MPRQVPRAILLPVYERRDDARQVRQHAHPNRQPRSPDLRPEIPAANHNRNCYGPLHLPARVASRPREHARNAREQPARRKDGPRVSRPRVRGREEGRVPRERDK